MWPVMLVKGLGGRRDLPFSWGAHAGSHSHILTVRSNEADTILLSSGENEQSNTVPLFIACRVVCGVSL